MALRPSAKPSDLQGGRTRGEVLGEALLPKLSQLHLGHAGCQPAIPPIGNRRYKSGRCCGVCQGDSATRPVKVKPSSTKVVKVIPSCFFMGQTWTRQSRFCHPRSGVVSIHFGFRRYRSALNLRLLSGNRSGCAGPSGRVTKGGFRTAHMGIDDDDGTGGPSGRKFGQNCAKWRWSLYICGAGKLAGVCFQDLSVCPFHGV
ncbi:MAG: hypothetical protein JWR19_3894 [Pedosphaera sp.]|nr:hypothetical protein [Pedosphaera sp.]